MTALSEEELAQRIRADRVDILVELTGEAVLWGVAGGLFVVGEGGGVGGKQGRRGADEEGGKEGP